MPFYRGEGVRAQQGEEGTFKVSSLSLSRKSFTEQVEMKWIGRLGWCYGMSIKHHEYVHYPHGAHLYILRIQLPEECCERVWGLATGKNNLINLDSQYSLGFSISYFFLWQQYLHHLDFLCSSTENGTGRVICGHDCSCCVHNQNRLVDRFEDIKEVSSYFGCLNRISLKCSLILKSRLG